MGNHSQYSIAEFSRMELMRAESLLKQMDPAQFDAMDYYGLQVSEQDYGKEFEGSKIKKSHFNKCSFTDVSFFGTSGASSSFKECVLKNCQIKNACFDFTDFSRSDLMSDGSTSNTSSSSFAYTNFSDAKLDGIALNGCNFESSYFKNATISNSKCQHCSFENAYFENTVFENIDLSQTNIDFSIMKGVTFKNVKLPLTSVLHSFGGLQNAEKHAENITFKFPSSDVEVSFFDLVSKLEDIQAFFFKISDFFTLSAINIYFGTHDLAYQYLGRGLVHSLKQKDFRMIGYYCKLASLNHFFTKDQLRKLYEKLRSNELVQTMTNHEYHVYLYEMDRIKRLLIDNPFGLPQMKISIVTNIHLEEIALTSEMLSHLNETLEECLPQASNYLTVRHDSPLQFEMFLSDSIDSLYNFALILSTALIGLTASISKIQKIIAEHYKIKGIKLDNKLKELDIEKKKLQLGGQDNRRLPKQEKKSILPSARMTERIVSISYFLYTDLELPEDLREVTIENKNS